MHLCDVGSDTNNVVDIFRHLFWLQKANQILLSFDY